MKLTLDHKMRIKMATQFDTWRSGWKFCEQCAVVYKKEWTIIYSCLKHKMRCTSNTKSSYNWRKLSSLTYYMASQVGIPQHFLKIIVNSRTGFSHADFERFFFRSDICPQGVTHIKMGSANNASNSGGRNLKHIYLKIRTGYKTTQNNILSSTRLDGGTNNQITGTRFEQPSKPFKTFLAEILSSIHLGIAVVRETHTPNHKT